MWSLLDLFKFCNLLKGLRAEAPEMFDSKLALEAVGRALDMEASAITTRGDNHNVS
jgi:hypothetical protein